MLRSICVTAAGAAVLLTGGGSAWAAAPSPAPSVSACSGVVEVDGFAFTPAAVLPGGDSAAVLAVTNCTAQAQTVSEQWTGRFSSLTGTGIPAGCPVIDPLPRSQALPAHTEETTATTYTVPAGCTADRLTVTVQLSQDGTPLATASAVLTINRSTTG